MEQIKKHLLKADKLWNESTVLKDGKRRGRMFKAMLAAADLTGERFDALHGKGKTSSLGNGVIAGNESELEYLIGILKAREPEWFDQAKEDSVRTEFAPETADEVFVTAEQIDAKGIADFQRRMKEWELPANPKERLEEYIERYADKPKFPPKTLCERVLHESWKDLAIGERFELLVKDAQERKLNNTGRGISVDRMAELVLGVSGIKNRTEARSLHFALDRFGRASRNEAEQLHNIFDKEAAFKAASNRLAAGAAR